MDATYPSYQDIRRIERLAMWLLGFGFAMGLTFGCWTVNQDDTPVEDTTVATTATR